MYLDQILHGYNILALQKPYLDFVTLTLSWSKNNLLNLIKKVSLCAIYLELVSRIEVFSACILHLDMYITHAYYTWTAQKTDKEFWTVT